MTIIYGTVCEPCGSPYADPVLGREDVLGFGVGMIRCWECGAKRYSRAVRSAKEVNDGDAAHFLAERTAMMGAMDNNDASRAEEFRSHIRGYYLGLVERLRTAAGRTSGNFALYEVGFNVGDFLLAAEASGVAKLGGCEPNGRGVAIARARLQLPGARLSHAFFSDAPTFLPEWDAVAMLDVLEHTEEPRGDLERARALLRPGGVVLVKTFLDEFHDGLTVPSDRSAYGNFAAAGYHDPLGHLWHFDRVSLRRLVERVGLRLIFWEEDAAWGQVTLLAIKA